MTFWKEERVLEIIKYTDKPHCCNHLQSKAADNFLDSQVSSSAKLGKRWKLEGTQSNLQVSTASDHDAE